jgi:hypothetical protein
LNEDYLMRMKALEMAIETHGLASESRILQVANHYYEFLSGNNTEEKK